MPRYPIQPSDINTDKSFHGAFLGDRRTEETARMLVRMAQVKGGWNDFTKNEIYHFCGHGVLLKYLVSDGTLDPPLKINSDGTLSYTHKFIAKCFLTAPVITEVK